MVSCSISVALLLLVDLTLCFWEVAVKFEVVPLNLKWVLSKAFKLWVVFLPLRITFLLEKSRDGIKGKELIFFFFCLF